MNDTPMIFGSTAPPGSPWPEEVLEPPYHNRLNRPILNDEGRLKHED